MTFFPRPDRVSRPAAHRSPTNSPWGQSRMATGEDPFPWLLLQGPGAPPLLNTSSCHDRTPHDDDLILCGEGQSILAPPEQARGPAVFEV